jgi:hypothetical protein
MRNIESLKKSWVSVAAASAKISERVHKLAVETLTHYATKGNGDTSLCSFAVNTMWKTGNNRRALIQWFEKHGKMKLVQVDKDNVKFTKNKGFDHTTVDLDKADKSPYYMDDDAFGQTSEDVRVFDGPAKLRAIANNQKKIKAGEAKGEWDLEKSKFMPDEMVDALINWADMLEGKETTDKPVFKGTHVQTGSDVIAKLEGANAA